MLIICFSIKINLINIFAQNQDNNVEYDYTIICGDFNLVLDSMLDSYNYNNLNNPKAQSMLISTNEHELGLAHTYWYTYATRKRYTWRRKKPLKQARLGYFLVSSPLVDLIGKCDINSGYHYILELSIIVNPFSKSKGVWWFDNSLLYEKEY